MNETAEFFEQGIRLCPRGLAAMTDFRRMVADTSKHTVIERLDRISEALGVRLHANDVRPYHSPSDIEEEGWNGNEVWAAAKVEIPSFGSGYFGIYWGGPSHCDSGDARIVAAFALKTRPDTDRLMDLCRRHESHDWKNENIREVSLFEALPAQGTHQAFPTSLGSLIDRWVAVFRTIGGTSGFRQVSPSQPIVD